MNARITRKPFIAFVVICATVPLAVMATHDRRDRRDVPEYQHILNEADANYRSALAQCDDLSEKSRRQCRNEAQDTLQRQREMAEQQRVAGYESAMEKCEPLHFNAQDVCEKEAAATYGENN